MVAFMSCSYIPVNHVNHILSIMSITSHITIEHDQSCKLYNNSMFISHFCHACNPYHENHIRFSLSIMQIMPSILSVIRGKHVMFVHLGQSCRVYSSHEIHVNHIISIYYYWTYGTTRDMWTLSYSLSIMQHCRIRSVASSTVMFIQYQVTLSHSFSTVTLS